MISRIDTTFDSIRKEKRAGLVGYLTAGDPDYRTSLKNILAGIEVGIDVLELGVPFSDPTADGPVIQSAAHRALSSGMSVARVLKLVEDIRRESGIPVILFGYANPFFHYGFANIARDAASAGADGMLIVDLPFEESGEARGHLDSSDLALIPLVAPTTPPERMQLILKGSRGFIYYIMVTGVTGQRASVAEDVKEQVARIKEFSGLPVAAGFGISNGSQAALAASAADAIVVGSAFVSAAQQGRLAPLVREISTALRRQ
jgi:tryptophan synthase alpha chain